MRFLAGVEPAADAQADGPARSIAEHFGHDDRRGGGIFAEVPAYPAAHRLLVGLWTAA